MRTLIVDGLFCETFYFRAESTNPIEKRIKGPVVYLSKSEGQGVV